MVTYDVKGYDEDGPFEGSRRYNDFYHLRNGLQTRMPGIYIPPIPPKKAIGNKNDKFLEERKYFLERFLKLICRIGHIIKSDEFRLFSRPSGDVEKTMIMLQVQTPESILERLTTEFELPEEENPSKSEEYRSIINEYRAFIKKIVPILKTLRDQVKPMISHRDQQNQNYKNMLMLMSHYEEGALIEYANSNSSKLVVGNSLNPIYLDTADDVQEKLKNPYQEFYYWIKGELYDIQALNETINGLERMFKSREKAEAKKKNDGATLNKLSTGKTTFKTMFAGAARKETMKTEMSNGIEKSDRDIDLYTKIINILERHIATTVIPNFKVEKQNLYYKILLLFSVHEIHN